MAKKKTVNKLEELMKALDQKGLTYKQFQTNETKGLMKFKGGKILVKGKDY